MNAKQVASFSLSYRQLKNLRVGDSIPNVPLLVDVNLFYIMAESAIDIYTLFGENAPMYGLRLSFYSDFTYKAAIHSLQPL